MNVKFSPIQQFLITWLLLLVAGWLTIGAISYVGEIVSILITAGLVAFLLNYPVSKLQKILPRSLAAGLVYLTAALIILVIGLTIVPPVLNQARQLWLKFPDLLESARWQLTEFQTWSENNNLPFDFGILQQQLSAKAQEEIQAIATTSFGLVLGTVNWFFDLILILVISFYMLLDGERVWNNLTSIIAPKVRDVFTKSLEVNLQSFISGQLLLGLFMATTLSFAFWFLGVPYFLLFAVFIGVMELIPFIGATLGIGTVGSIVTFINWWLALKVLIVAIALQQIKDNIVAPRVMGNLTGLSPVIIFAALLLGGKIGGLLGVILAIPLTGVLKSIVEVVLNPKLPPQTGSFFYNPMDEENEVSEIEIKQLNQQVSP
ncbi:MULTISPECIES: AI-2E family transporter [Okeania]|uniref:AI-2E family transporter n=1 Tax=Okeania hirsuta TaxID=1458930 RepID=A0A3N6QCF5_9CYAN|nr:MULTISPECIES: AI-2E family transporter [Okeania]NES79904.1 AI-2E family transporter [Okeania sp. SIO1H4]NES89446.1 AI-2E family transporter [Okeania sp. SIO2B9]NET23614.1 AI-2E family transporter [Okeania sp. SIO1H5]NET80305.1 AI-2E family transporter [Okeania sp. SIO1F9]NET97437.1 AI-2E family transporter [Okeania sp. SIO1H2]